MNKEPRILRNPLSNKYPATSTRPDYPGTARHASLGFNFLYNEVSCNIGSESAALHKSRLLFAFEFEVSEERVAKNYLPFPQASQIKLVDTYLTSNPSSFITIFYGLKRYLFLPRPLIRQDVI